MPFVIFISIAVFIIYVVYTLSDIFDGNQVRKRLKKVALASPRTNKLLREETDLKTDIFKFIAPINEYVSKKVNLKSIEKLLVIAGLPADEEDVYKLVGQKVLYGLFGLTFAFFIVIACHSAVLYMKIGLFTLCPSVLFILPDMRLKGLAKKRTDEIKYNMPDALDLLTVCVEAGLALDASFVRVSEEISRTSPVISHEFGRISKDIRAGIPRQTAFRNLAARNNVPDLNTFVALLIQTEKLGTSIGSSLRIYSDTMRVKRRQRVEALAAQASVKMVIPLVLFVMPSMFVVLLGPAALQFISVFAAK